MTNIVYENNTSVYERTRSSLGIILVISLLGNYYTTGIFHNFMGGIVYPTFILTFGLINYLPKTWKNFRKCMITGLITCVLPSYASFAITRLYSNIINNYDNKTEWNRHIQYTLYSILYSSPKDIGEVNTIGVVWLPITIFFAWTALSIINCVFISIIHKKYVKITPSLYRRYSNIRTIISISIGIIGIVLVNLRAIIPFNINTIFVAIMLMGIGVYFREYKVNISRRLKTILIIISGIIGCYGILSGNLMDLTNVRYPGFTGGIFCSAFGIYAFFELIQYILKLYTIRDFGNLISRHFIMAFVMYELGAVWSILWRSEIVIIASIIRIIISISMCELVVQTIGIFSPKLKLCKYDRQYAYTYSNAYNNAFYFALVLYFFSYTLDQIRIDDFISSDIQNDLKLLSTSIMLFIYCMKIIRYKDKRVCLFITIAICICACFAEIRSDKDSLLGLFVVVAASVGCDIHLTARIIWIEGLAIMLTMHYLSMNGYVEYSEIVDLASENLTPHTFGFRSKNGLSAFLYTNLIAYCISRKNKERLLLIPDIVIIGFALFIDHRYIGGKTDEALMAMLLVGNIVYRLIGKEPLKNKQIRTVVKLIHYILGVPIFIVMELLFIWISWNYNGLNSPLDSILSRFFEIDTYHIRLLMTKTALMIYKINLWGQPIAEILDPEYYFFVDSAYVRILLEGGIINNILFLVIMTMTQYINAKHGKYYYVMIGAIMAVGATMSRYTLLVPENIIAFTAFASLAITEDKRHGKISINIA